MRSILQHFFFFYSTLTLFSQVSLGAVIPRSAVSNDNGSNSLIKRIIVQQIVSPLTQVKPGSTIPIIGENMSGTNPSYNLTSSLDSTLLGTFPDVSFAGDTFRIHVTIPSTTTDGTHQVCVANAAEQTQYCMELLVCSSNCHPTLGFLDGNGISFPTATRQPSGGNFTVVGDAFQPGESLSLSLDIPYIGDQHLDDTGRFEFWLSVTGFPVGDYTINVEGQDSADSASAHFSLSNVVDF